MTRNLHCFAMSLQSCIQRLTVLSSLYHLDASPLATYLPIAFAGEEGNITTADASFVTSSVSLPGCINDATQKPWRIAAMDSTDNFSSVSRFDSQFRKSSISIRYGSLRCCNVDFPVPGKPRIRLKPFFGLENRPVPFCFTNLSYETLNNCDHLSSSQFLI